jgi:glycosyltransferase involved in cell wall biosynthesis
VWRLPIVCSDLPVLREVAGDAALYLEPDDDPLEVARRVLALLDGDAVVRLAGNTRRTSSWEAVYRTMIEPLLRSIAVTPGPADDRLPS